VIGREAVGRNNEMPPSGFDNIYALVLNIYVHINKYTYDF
jgi:hypothetical protein